MMKASKSILVCDKIAEIGIKMLKEAGYKVDVELDLTQEQLRKKIVDYDCIVIRSRTLVTKDIIEAGKKLVLIARAGVGIDNIDLEVAKRRKIEIITTPEAPTTSVAELTLGLMISLARKIPEADKSIKEGKWIKHKLMGILLKGKTLGIIGFGRIGSLVGKLAHSLGMSILVVDPRVDEKKELLEQINASAVSLEELLKKSDFVTLHVPLTNETYHMINEQTLKLMKKGSFLINTSRGKVVDEEALFKALKGGWIAGAALDVYEVEPPRKLELIKMPNVICTPHIGGQTKETQELIGRMIASKIIERLSEIGAEV